MTDLLEALAFRALPRGPWLEELAYRLLPRVAPGRALADSEWRTLAAYAEVLLDGVPVETTPARVADHLERFLIAGRSRRAWRCRVLFTLIELATLPTHGRTFSSLDVDARRSVILERFAAPDAGRLDRICSKARYLVLVGIYGDDERAPRATGFVPVPLRPRFSPARPAGEPRESVRADVGAPIAAE